MVGWVIGEAVHRRRDAKKVRRAMESLDDRIVDLQHRTNSFFERLAGERLCRSEAIGKLANDATLAQVVARSEARRLDELHERHQRLLDYMHLVEETTKPSPGSVRYVAKPMGQHNTGA